MVRLGLSLRSGRWQEYRARKQAYQELWTKATTPRHDPPRPMTIDEIRAAANVLELKHQRGELTAAEFALLSDALQMERQGSSG